MYGKNVFCQKAFLLVKGKKDKYTFLWNHREGCLTHCHVLGKTFSGEMHFLSLEGYTLTRQGVENIV